MRLASRLMLGGASQARDRLALRLGGSGQAGWPTRASVHSGPAPAFGVWSRRPFSPPGAGPSPRGPMTSASCWASGGAGAQGWWHKDPQTGCSPLRPAAPEGPGPRSPSSSAPPPRTSRDTHIGTRGFGLRSTVDTGPTSSPALDTESSCSRTIRTGRKTLHLKTQPPLGMAARDPWSISGGFPQGPMS